jgi:ribonuclease Z
VDAGGSTYQRLLRAGLDPLRIRAIVLTHSHCDHINGLPALLFSLKLSGFSAPLTIAGNEPTLALARRVLDAFGLEGYQAAAEWLELEAGQPAPLAMSSFRLRTAATVHSRPCLALRFEDPATERAIVYSADTEPCAAVTELARGAAVLIHEATTPGPFHFSPRWTMSAAQAIDEVRAGGFQGAASIGREFETYSL